MFHLIIVLVAIGVLLWAFNAYVPCDQKIKTIINVVVVICVVLYLLKAFGILSEAHDIPVPKL